MGANAERVYRCPTCGKDWPVSRATCPEDGTRLTLPTATTNVVLEKRNTLSSALDVDTEVELIGTDPFRSEIPPRRPRLKTSDQQTASMNRIEPHIDLPPGSVVGDEYEIGELLGAGAMGEVYAARNVKLGKRVAIKVISPRNSEDTETVERFVQEAKTLARMHHPGLVDVLGFGELSDGRAYFVMEYLSGESLFDRLARGRLDWDEALDIFRQMARAIDAAHAHGVIHRDLKPENTFLMRVTNDERPIVKLLDFGLAKLGREIDVRAVRTERGVVLGTAMYLSPEQARGVNVDARTDIYALGCIGYELLLGRHPFKDECSVAAVISAHLDNTPPIPRSIDPSIPPAIDLMLFAMLGKDPNYRPTLVQIRAVLEGSRLATEPGQPVPPPKAASVLALMRSWDWRMVVIAVLVLIIGIGIGAAVRG